MLTYFPGTLYERNDFRGASEKYALTAALVLIVLALWRQYSRRATIASRIPDCELRCACSHHCRFPSPRRSRLSNCATASRRSLRGFC